jgi:hypothetical protein
MAKPTIPPTIKQTIGKITTNAIPQAGIIYLLLLVYQFLIDCAILLVDKLKCSTTSLGLPDLPNSLIPIA